MLPLPKRNPFPMIAEALGAKHGYLDLPDSCMESD